MSKIRFPAEFEKHDATLMIWPVRPGSWGKDPSGAQKAFVTLFKEILKSEDLYVLFGRMTSSDIIDSLKEELGDTNFDFVPLIIDSDDSWARDTGYLSIRQR